MNWYKISQLNNNQTWEKILSEIELKYPKVQNMVDGRIVRPEIPNTSSIDSSLENYIVLTGVREVPMSEFDVDGKHWYNSVEGNQKISKLTEEIRNSKEISPLIIVVDKEGPYILEGSTRIDALYRLGANSFPALVVVDKENIDNL